MPGLLNRIKISHLPAFLVYCHFPPVLESHLSMEGALLCETTSRLKTSEIQAVALHPPARLLFSLTLRSKTSFAVASGMKGTWGQILRRPQAGHPWES